MLLFFYSGNQTKAFLLTHKTWQSLAVIVGTLPKPNTRQPYQYDLSLQIKYSYRKINKPPLYYQVAHAKCLPESSLLHVYNMITLILTFQYNLLSQPYKPDGRLAGRFELIKHVTKYSSPNNTCLLIFYLNFYVQAT